MPSPTPIADGNLVFGSQVLTISGVQFIAEQISVARPVLISTWGNAAAAPTKSVFVKQPMQGSAILQLPNATTAAPAAGNTVAIVPVGGGTARTFHVTEVGEVLASDGVAKVTIQLFERLNGSPIASAVFYDGDFTAATSTAPPRLHYEQIYAAYILREDFVVNAANFTGLPIGSTYPTNPAFFLTEETEPQPVAGTPLVTFQRIYAQVPATRFEYIGATKTFKRLLKQITNGQLSAATVVSQSTAVVALVTYNYSRTPSAFGNVYPPDVNIVTVGQFTFVDPTNGFPFNAGSATPDVTPGGTWLSNNVRRWRGDIYEQMVVTF